MTNKKRWLIADRKYDDVIQQLLLNRGILGEKLDGNELDKFLNPQFERDLFDPLLLPNINKALERITLAVERKEKIGIFADYDADGVPGAALLKRAFDRMGVRSKVFIPSRDAGYGLSEDGINYLMGEGCNLIISIDLGIRNNKEAEYCREKGIDLIITDHHLPSEEVPAAFAVINPKLIESKYPYQELCGCGVIYKLIQGLANSFSEIDESFLKWNLDLVAISTIADMVPLTGENRVLAKYGLIVLRKTKNTGLKALCKAAGIARSKIDPYIVGFQIGPRINTPGRIDHATKSLDLLVSQDEVKAAERADWLNQKNSERQYLMDKVFEEAIGQIEENKIAENKIIIVAGKWERGVLGPPASRLVERFNRPVIVFAEEEEEYVGSARSIPGVNIVELLSKAEKQLMKYGGHKGAAGLSVEKNNYLQFLEAINKVANDLVSQELMIKQIKADLELAPDEITELLYNSIENLAPFGLGNPKPIFCLRGVEMTDLRYVGASGNHLSGFIKCHRKRFKCIYFNCQPDLIIKPDTLYDVLFSLGLDTWNGNKQLSLTLIDIKEHAKKE